LIAASSDFILNHHGLLVPTISCNYASGFALWFAKQTKEEGRVLLHCFLGEQKISLCCNFYSTEPPPVPPLALDLWSKDFI